MNNSSTISLPKPLSPAEARIAWRITDKNESFTSFIFGDKVNQAYLGVALVGTVIQFIVFKFLYPFPDFFSDSYSYIYGAAAHLDINIWPIGYSKFLGAFHTLTHSDTALVGFQYFFVELSAAYFFFTWRYFFRPGRNSTVILFLFLFFNPLFLYVSNYVNSDPLFAALSLFWFTELIWIVNRPRPYQIFTQGVLLFLAFTVRNNAYIYPVIAMVAFLLSRQRAWMKVAGILLAPALILPFVLHTREAAKDMTGTAQFSLFTGWQLANNALYMYPHIRVDASQLPSPQVKELDQITRDFYSRTIPQFPEILKVYTGNLFIREPRAPLKRYLDSNYKPASDEYSYVVAWGQASAVFADYGGLLIKQNPLAYARYFMLLNASNYFLPPLEKLLIYNLGEDKVGPLAQKWFDWESTSVRSVSSTAQGMILLLFPGLFLLLNLFFIGALAWGLITGKLRKGQPGIGRWTILASCFLAMNAAFCIYATIIVFRYEFFPMIIFLAADLLLYELLDRGRSINKRETLQR